MKEYVIKFFHLQGNFASDEKYVTFIVLFQQFMNMNLEIPFTSPVILFIITSVWSQTFDFCQYMIHRLLTTVHYSYHFLGFHMLFIIVFHYFTKSCFLPRDSFLFTCPYLIWGNTCSFCDISTLDEQWSTETSLISRKLHSRVESYDLVLSYSNNIGTWIYLITFALNVFLFDMTDSYSWIFTF